MFRQLGVTVLMALAGAAQAQEVGRISARGMDIVQYQVPQPDGPSVEYFIAQTKQPAPLVLFIQGSGCTPAFTGLGTPQRSANVFGFLDTMWTGKYAVMTVNKPYSPRELPPDGTASQCPAAFNDYFDLDNWTRDLALAVSHARKLPWVAPGPMLVIGISEGATAAATLAARGQHVSNVAMLAGSGPTQYYDLVVNAYRTGANDADTLGKIAELEAARQRIMAAPGSGKNMVWGHSYKRWSSFFRASSTLSLLSTNSKVYLLTGMQDGSVPALSTEALAAELSAAGHNVTLRRLPDAGHELKPTNAPPEALWPEYQRILDWFQP